MYSPIYFATSKLRSENDPVRRDKTSTFRPARKTEIPPQHTVPPWWNMVVSASCWGNFIPTGKIQDCDTTGDASTTVSADASHFLLKYRSDKINWADISSWCLFRFTVCFMRRLAMLYLSSHVMHYSSINIGYRHRPKFFISVHPDLVFAFVPTTLQSSVHWRKENTIFFPLHNYALLFLLIT